MFTILLFYEEPANNPAEFDHVGEVELIRFTQNGETMLRGFQGIALLNHLKQREPDDRIGYTMFVFELTDEEITNVIIPTISGE